MDFSISPRGAEYLRKLEKFQKEVLKFEKSEEIYFKQLEEEGRWRTPPCMRSWKEEAKKRGLWNLFIPSPHPEGPGLSPLDFAYLCEKMGEYPLTSEACNCSAPDTGNMELLLNFGSEKQKKEWLSPLLEGEIRSAFLMTEPEVASSDARNIKCKFSKKNGKIEVNGHKWWSSGAMNEDCKLLIVLGKFENQKNHSIVLVPREKEGVEIKRPMTVLG